MKLRIGAEDIRVVDLDPESGAHGEWRPDERTIAVRADLGPHTKALALLHEAIHAITDQYGIHLSEARTRVLEQAIGAFLRDNPEVTRSLLCET